MLLKRTQNFAKTLFDVGAVKVDTKEGFRLALHDTNPTAPLSPIYFNLRTRGNKKGPLLKKHVDAIATELLALASKHRLRYDAIAGIPRAGTPFAKAMVRISQETDPKAYVNIRKVSSKTRAMRSEPISIEHIEAGTKRVLLVDDLITRADTKLIAIKALRDAGFEVAGVVVFLDREQGGIRELRQAMIPVFATVPVTDLLGFYADESLINKKDLRIIKAYLKR